MYSIVFVDSEISAESGKILDLGAIKGKFTTTFHSTSVEQFSKFVAGMEYICGHNILAHDLKYIGRYMDQRRPPAFIDTLYLSPLFFPCHQRHSLLKDDKLQTEELNNPLNDAKKAMELFFNELNAYQNLSPDMKKIYESLLSQRSEFSGFFQFNTPAPTPSPFKFKFIFKSTSKPMPTPTFKPSSTSYEIKKKFKGKICANTELTTLIQNYPIELAYALSLIASNDSYSVIPPWVLRNYPRVENILKILRSTPCVDGCDYCSNRLNVRSALKRIFKYDSFRTYNGEPLQEKAADAAIHGKSLLAVFPTGGGKSITFQLPALMAGESEHGLTIVISPLQSLMKDQVDNLAKAGIIDAVTVNGLLSPIERAEALHRVENGMASLLYISPEQLRSKTIERLLLSRNITRFVVDEAHCFSAWGQDFRVDYLYISTFIQELQQKKGSDKPIPVSCFTATAKQKVISDIKDYFKEDLKLELELFATDAVRANLRYAVLFKETDEDKYNALRELIESKACPTIVYVSRTKRTMELAQKLSSDGFPAKPFHGQMDSMEKIANQEAFIENEVQVIVATSAFGMGVDKKDVKLVIHYDISDSLENYVQEAGRAGRDQSLQADCYVLFNNNDLDKHFVLLNQTKLSISEIQQVWKAIKDLTKQRPNICCSPLEIARQAGWDDSVSDIEARVKTAVAALEDAGYIKRGRNVPRIYASSILAKNMQEASAVLEKASSFTEQQRQNARRIISSLISSRSIAKAGNDDAESRVDYLADMLGISKRDVIDSIHQMREVGLLADTQDMSAYIYRTDTLNKSAQILQRFIKLESFFLSQIPNEGDSFNLKELNELALKNGCTYSNVQNIRKLLYYWNIKGYIKKELNNSDKKTTIRPTMDVDKLSQKFECRKNICRFVVQELYAKSTSTDLLRQEAPVQFSLFELYRSYCSCMRLQIPNDKVKLSDIEDALLYLSKINALHLEGGFLVLYNGMEIKRLITDNKIRYKVENYKKLNEFYKQKIQQIHIVGEYANLMVRDYDAALKYVQDYFQMDYKKFLATYFKGERSAEINRNITPEKYNQLFGQLSDVQAKIIQDDTSKYIVVAAGPGSGKTRVLVHKLAALLLMEDVKHEQLLMVTFSRAAATEFKKRLIDLIGNAANFVDIKTFHSYCFDLLGKVGSLDGVENVVKDAAEMIRNGEVELGRITKTVVVIDEAQDMDQHEFALIEALMQRNDNMRIIAVGDDDQNIYEFRGSNSDYLRSFISKYGAVQYEMVDNYRSKANIVALSNAFVSTISNRMKFAPGRAVQQENGIVQLIHHNCFYLEEAVVNQLVATYKNGTACVLTNTNDEAMRVLSLLTMKGIHATLIQSNDGFCFYNLAEVRFLLKVIDKKFTSHVISDDLWNYAKETLKNTYQNSSCLDICLKMMADFEETNKVKYRTDFFEFILESNYDDFYENKQGAILISTIHKSKGREFDQVYMLMNRNSISTDESCRKIYVGLTRAKEALYIHYNNNIFDGLSLAGVEHIEDTRFYREPDSIILPLSHRDVALGFFRGKKDIILRLRSGMALHVDNEFLSVAIQGQMVRVLKFSKACLQRLEELSRKGYQPEKAVIRFIVAWKAEEDNEESAVILPNLYLKRR